MTQSICCDHSTHMHSVSASAHGPQVTLLHFSVPIFASELVYTTFDPLHGSVTVYVLGQRALGESVVPSHLASITDDLSQESCTHSAYQVSKSHAHSCLNLTSALSAASEIQPRYTHRRTPRTLLPRGRPAAGIVEAYFSAYRYAYFYALHKRQASKHAYGEFCGCDIDPGYVLSTYRMARSRGRRDLGSGVSRAVPAEGRPPEQMRARGTQAHSLQALPWSRSASRSRQDGAKP
jgi:hypothetical protein